MKRRFPIILALFVVGSAVALHYAWLWRHTEALRLTVPPVTFRAARPVFPYSVVPGGVYDWQDLSDSIRADPVVAKHYRTIRPETLWPARTRTAMLAYVSYRQRDTVSWTKHKVVIPKGELVLTDGYNMIRSRCGNRIKVAPPEVQTADTVTEDPPPDIVFETAPPTPFPSAPQPTFVAVAKPPAAPPVPVAEVCCEPVVPVTPILSPVPEPGTLLLLATGLASTAMAAYRRGGRRGKSSGK